MKTQLRLVKHDVLPDEHVVELWHDGKFLGALYGADGPGFRLMTRRAIIARNVPIDAAGEHRGLNVELVDRGDAS